MKRWLANHAHLGGRHAIAALLVVGIVIGSIAIAALVASNYQKERDQDQRADLHRVAVALDRFSAAAISQLRSAATFLELQPKLGGGQFQRLVDSLAAEDQMAAVALLEGARVDQLARPGRLGGPDRARRRLLLDDGLGFNVQLRSSDAVEGMLWPATAGTANSLADALGRARDSGSPAVSRTVRLRGSDDRHLVIFQPVRSHGGDSAGREPGARRLVAGVISVSDLLAAAAIVVPSETRVALVSEGEERLSTEPRPFESYSATPLVIADRRWDLRLEVAESQIWALPLIVGLAGLILAGAIGLLLLNWSRRERGVIDLARTRLEQRDRAMRAEAEINRMYRLLAENLTDMVMVVTPAGTITYVSPAGERMLGWKPEQMTNQSVLSFLHSDDVEDAHRHLASLRDGAAIHTFEHRLRRADGSYIWVESAIRSVFARDSGQVLELQSATRDISERKPLQEQLERLAREDPLTGLSNRRQFNEMLAAELARAERSGESCAVLLIDVDHFKQVNDSYGHLAGDRLLRRLSEALRSRMRRSDTVARLGGDEFAAILPDAGADEALPIAHQLTEAVREALLDDPDLPRVTVSIGIAIFDGAPEVSGEVLLERADLALYRAKAGGRDRADVYVSGAGAISSKRT